MMNDFELLAAIEKDVTERFLEYDIYISSNHFFNSETEFNEDLIDEMALFYCKNNVVIEQYKKFIKYLATECCFYEGHHYFLCLYFFYKTNDCSDIEEVAPNFMVNVFFNDLNQVPKNLYLLISQENSQRRAFIRKIL